MRLQDTWACLKLRSWECIGIYIDLQCLETLCHCRWSLGYIRDLESLCCPSFSFRKPGLRTTHQCLLRRSWPAMSKGCCGYLWQSEEHGGLPTNKLQKKRTNCTNLSSWRPFWFSLAVSSFPTEVTSAHAHFPGLHTANTLVQTLLCRQLQPHAAVTRATKHLRKRDTCI